MPTPAAAATAAATRVRAAPASGSVSPATYPTTPNTTNPAAAAAGRFLATRPSRVPMARDTTTMPVMSANLSLVPKVEIAQSSTGAGVMSMTHWPMERIRDGADRKMPAISSEEASAAPVATTPNRA